MRSPCVRILLTLVPLVVLVALVLARPAAALLPPFPAGPPDDPRFAPATCPPAASCAGVSGQWNLLS